MDARQGSGGLRLCLLGVLWHFCLSAASLVSITVEPERSLLFGTNAQQRVIVTGRMAGGAEQDLTRQAVFSSTRPDIATVDAQGRITARRAGLAGIVVRAHALTASANVLVLGHSGHDRVDFVRDVQPILTMKGCNGGNCHGSMHGKNGFALSQFGYDAQLDYKMIVKAAKSRRVNFHDPGQSLILLKPTFGIPHGGGARFALNSQEYNTIARWIAQGAPEPQEVSHVRMDRLEVIPSEKILHAPGAEQQLIVLAHYTDRTIRDVTSEVQFLPKDESIVAVSEGGLIRAQREGETPIVIRATGALGMARVGVLSGRTIQDYPKPPANNFIDELVFEKLQRLRIVPSELCTDEVFLRRVYLDAIGVLPAASEVRAFLSDRSPDKRKKLVRAILDRPEYADYWGLLWADLLTVTAFKSGPSQAHYLDQWIRKQLRDNVSFDRFVRQVVAGEGAIRDNPGIALAASRPPEQVASFFSQLFLGIRIQCAECHDHPFERWKQKDYFGMVAFFSQVSSRNSKKGTLIYDDRGKKSKSPAPGRDTPPRFLGASAPVPASDAGPRKQLAAWMTSPDNPYFGRAVANRIWAHFMKEGLVEPVDDFRETNPPTNPRLLDALARHFMSAGYDLKSLMQVVMESRAYQLSSASNETNQNDTQQYSRYYTRRIYAEPLLDAITQLTAAPHRFRFGYPGIKAVELTDSVIPDSFLQTFDRNRREAVCDRGENITLEQTLKLISGDAISQKLRFQGGALDRLAGQGLADAEIIEELFLRALSRYPSAEERASLEDAIRSSKSRREGLEDLLWALLNSREFLFNH